MDRLEQLQRVVSHGKIHIIRYKIIQNGDSLATNRICLSISGQIPGDLLLASNEWSLEMLLSTVQCTLRNVPITNVDLCHYWEPLIQTT